MNKFFGYIKEVRVEMTKVSWPSRDEVVGATTLVVGMSVIVAIFVKIADLGLSKIVELLLKI